MKRCPYCAEEIQDAALICRFCSRDLDGGPIVSAATPPAAPAAIPATPPNRVFSIGCLGIIAIVITTIVINSLTKTSTPAPLHDTYDASAMCEKFVTDRLRAPSTAKFAAYSEQTVIHEGGGVYSVRSYVDSQNGFGAMLRMPFTCKVAWQSAKTWHLEDLNMQQ